MLKAKTMRAKAVLLEQQRKLEAKLLEQARKNEKLLEDQVRRLTLYLFSILRGEGFLQSYIYLCFLHPPISTFFLCLLIFLS